MGQQNTTEQVQQYINTDVTNVMTQTLVSKSTVVQSSVKSDQVMEGITMMSPPPGLCPTGTGPQDLFISQDATAVNTVGLSMAFRVTPCGNNGGVHEMPERETGIYRSICIVMQCQGVWG